ncbi:MAG: beta-ketoacyl-[acyl-carrier-protein] synthase family protein [Clostridiales bacterium]|jgi:3-oxoacyl-[acyl-carrier-protein] synthase II|nr:beta-ketoacyl-[acyl-carrier-protein] synthase family protein [Clostridiales bacterium]
MIHQHNPNTKIVITGMGAVTPIGIGVESFWKNLIAGKSGLSPITRFDSSQLPISVAAEIQDFQPEQHIPVKMAHRMARFTQYAYAAAGEALADSGYSVQPSRTGMVLGTAMGGVADIAQTQQEVCESGSKRVSPAFVPKILGNIPACQVAIAHNLRGPSFTLSTACASGDDAITLAAMLLRSGAADAMLAVGADAIECPIVISSLAASHILAHDDQEPLCAARPFDKNRNGFAIGEGGGALLLETEEHALARGAHIYAELLGSANNNDAFHITTPREGGEGGADCVRMALESAGLTVDDIDYVNAHGTGTVKGDQLECEAFHAVFGERASQVPMSSLKGATGHMMGAGGIVESIACILAIRDGMVPPTLNYRELDPACGAIDCVPNEARQLPVNIVMNNTFGFGGQNASLIFGRYSLAEA